MYVSSENMANWRHSTTVTTPPSLRADSASRSEARREIAQRRAGAKTRATRLGWRTPETRLRRRERQSGP
jgi:hypothetical protein